MLNAKQNAFCVEYVKDKNATQAAKRAGYSERTAQRIGSELLSKPLIKERIQELLDAAAERSAITVDTIVKRLNAIATDEEAKPSDRIRADELLGKYLGMFTDKLEMKGQIETSVNKLDGLLKQLSE